MMKKLLAVGIILLLIGVSIPSTGIVVKKSSTTSSDGNILYVGGSGEGNYSKIQDAIDDAIEGDTVFVYGKWQPYYVHLIINKSISLIGENRDTTVVDGGEHPEHKALVSVEAEGVTISGFTFKREICGILLLSDGNIVSDCKLLDNTPYSGIYICDFEENIVSNCYFNGNDWGAIIYGVDGYATNNIITHCTFAGDTIELTRAPNNLISDCYLNGGIGIKINHGSDGNRIVNCTLDSTSSGIDILRGGAFIENCTVRNTGVVGGISTSQTLKTIEVIILNCTLTHNFIGIEFGSSLINSIVSGCNISDNEYCGIIFYGCLQNTRVLDCHISNNDYGIITACVSLFNRFYRNNFVDNAERQFYLARVRPWWFMFNFFNGNYWSDWIGFGPYHVWGLVNWDLHPAQEPYNIKV